MSKESEYDNEGVEKEAGPILSGKCSVDVHLAVGGRTNKDPCA